VSNLQCLFEFNHENEAEAMLRASVPNMTFTKAEAFFWVVESIDSNHVGHSQPYRECEKNLYLTYAMKTTANAMSKAGCLRHATMFLSYLAVQMTGKASCAVT
jgi:hypothetical protein